MLIWWFNPKQRTLHVMAAGAYVLAMGNVLFMIALSCMGTAEGGYSAFSLLADMGRGGGDFWRMCSQGVQLVSVWWVIVVSG